MDKVSFKPEIDKNLKLLPEGYKPPVPVKTGK
jgi:hypothetical protein